jgi:hypothetical protein
MLSTVGWVKTSDPNGYQVNWANITTAPTLIANFNANAVTPSEINARGNWAAGTSYQNTLTGNVGNPAGATLDMVHGPDGLTYICMCNTQYTLTQCFQNTTQTFSANITACTTASGGLSTYNRDWVWRDELATGNALHHHGFRQLSE